MKIGIVPAGLLQSERVLRADHYLLAVPALEKQLARRKATLAKVAKDIEKLESEISRRKEAQCRVGVVLLVP